MPLGRSLYILPWVPGSTSDGEVEVIPHPASGRRGADTPPTSGGSSFALQYPYKEMAHIAHGTRVFVPRYGIFAVTCRSFMLHPADHTFLHFRPGRVIHGDLELRQGCVYEHHQPIFRLAVGSSGTYVLLLIGSQHRERFLGLVHFEETPVPHTTFRKLDVGDVSLHLCDQIALDDALGLVLLVDLEGETTVLSYV